MPIEVNRLCSVGFPPAQAKEIKKAIEEGASEGGLQIGTTGTTAMAGNRVPTATIRGGVLLQPAIADLTGTVGTANDAMTAIAAMTNATSAAATITAPAATFDAANVKTVVDAGLATANTNLLAAVNSLVTQLNTRITALNDDLADLQAKNNAQLAALRAAGIVTA